MRAARIESGIVVAVIEIGDPRGVAWAIENIGGQWVNGEGAEIGYAYTGGSFVRPPDGEPSDEVKA
jgi:hypothetical protein